MYNHITRQRGPLGPEASIWAYRTASKHDICHCHHARLALCSPNLSHMDFLDGPAAIHRCRLIIPCTTQDVSPNELGNPENMKNNHHRNIHSFTLILPAIFPDTDISSCVCIVLLFETSSSSHVQYHIARQRGPLGPEPAIGPCLNASDHKICHICIKCTNLVPPKSFSYGFSG